MKNKKQNPPRSYMPWVVVLFLVLVIASYVVASKKNSGDNENSETTANLDSFAQCLKDKGAVFYGAFWCSHCNNQKKAFGSSQKLLPYVECSTPDGKSQTKVCSDAGIEGYPTWVFPDGSRQSGEIPLKTLAQKTGCQLPQ